MGCNTSKESVQPAGEDAKEDAINGGEYKDFHFEFKLMVQIINNNARKFHPLKKYKLKNFKMTSNHATSVSMKQVLYKPICRARA